MVTTAKLTRVSLLHHNLNILWWQVYNLTLPDSKRSIYALQMKPNCAI